jgi:hypothetical protein
MPSASEILLGLSRVANGAVQISIVWHVALVVVAGALLTGFRPRERPAVLALSAPLASVGILAFVFENPFNGAIFTLLAAVLAALAWHTQPGVITFRSGWSSVLGVSLLVFGAVYPHFLHGASWVTYLYAAPFGAIPCPTLSVVIGAALMVEVFELRWWRLLLALAGSFYAIFGALRLGVWADAVLLCGALGLLVQSRHDVRAGHATVGRAS